MSRRIARELYERNIPMICAEVNGFIGYFRVVFKEHFGTVVMVMVMTYSVEHKA